MLKKFLKFLKGTSPEQNFDGSYLDHLLEQVRPRVQAKLEQCPEHDPLLLVVTEILRLTQPEQWTEELECPLADEQSPPLSAPPAPPAGDKPDDKLADESSGAFEIVEASEVISEADEDDDGETDEEAGDEDQAGAAVDEDNETGDAPDEDALDEDDASEDTDDEVHVDDDALVGASEVRPPAPPEPSALESTGLDPVPLDEAPEAHADIGADELDATELAELESAELGSHADEAAAVDEPKRLDSPEVLQAGRIFLGLLIENDRLPKDMQLSIAETMLARDLLLGYFVHDGKFDDKVKELLSLVEQKFNDGAFSQARILLQLFQRDRPNQINNDRNLFYEDMILRLGIRRRNLINNTLLAELAEKAGATDLDVGLTNSTAWLDQNLHIKFHLFTRVPDDAKAWREFAAQSRRKGADDVFSRYIPPKRWRPLHTASQPPSERIVDHVSAATVKRYIVRQIKACYFVLRAVGDTGLEPYLDAFFDWSESQFDFNSVRLMPLVYRQTMSETQLIDKIFEDAFRRFFQKEAAKFLASFNEDTVLETTRELLDDLPSLDFNRIPPGDYDLGGLILDRLFGFEYPDPEFAFKLHRLT
jgi:hypothetical protein